MGWKCFFILLHLVFSTSVLALSEARLVNKSFSSKTVVFNLGSYNKISVGEFAVVGKHIQTPDHPGMRVVPVARARSIKLNSDSSIWILYKVFDPSQLVVGDKFVLLTESHMLNGRREPEVGEVLLVTQESKEKEQTKFILEQDQDRLSKLKDKYDPLAFTRETQYRADTDLEQVSVDSWRKSNNSRHRTALYRGPEQKDFKRHLRLETFEKMVTLYFKRVNDPDFNYDEFYEASRRTDFANEFKAQTDHETEYNKFITTQSKKTYADARLFRSVLLRGESWSEDYSDEELRKLLNEVSVLHEIDRRGWVAARPNRYNLAFDYGFILTDSQNNTDQGYHRDNNRTLDFDLEVVPLLKHKVLERLTLNGSFRFAQNALDIGQYNAGVNEYSFSVGANWYPFFAPYTTDVPVFFVGVYLRSGFAYVEAPSANERANYTVLSLPGLRAGVKFLLRNNWGLRLIASMESLRLDQYEASEVSPVLPETANLVEGKFSVGVTYGF